ncbi:type II toxin-antitoxin system YafQ family toxin [Lacticaseibacillus kribbianus]|uniref:type II toxin-antitoxin system YafQ family toxin n=1 Tax=Lacticaseibacillus kribbianus TaxID=2926292 RepID=UPI001CD6E57B|nr:type II toxin-antitoxin system YafQ family toxin [Lacticaseibacillus kribbianus]
MPRFVRDYKRLTRKHYDIKQLDTVISMIQTGGHEEELRRRYFDHPLEGSWEGHRDLHVVGGRRGDWLLLYQIDIETNTLRLVRSGSHQDLFGI